MPKVELHSTENGPNQVLVDGVLVAEVCRCGRSYNRPFCDGTYETVGFSAPEARVKVVD